MQRILVLGLGKFGFTLAAELSRKKCEVVVIDKDKDKVQDIKDFVSHAVVGNAGDKDVLLELGVKNFDVACVCLGTEVAASILLTSFLKEAGVRRILAKATTEDHAKVLRLVGATDVTFPEKDEAIRHADNLVNTNCLDVIRLSDAFDIVEIAAPKEFYNKTLKGLDLRKKYGVHVIGIKNALDGALHIVPQAEHKIRPDDILIMIGDVDALGKMPKA